MSIQRNCSILLRVLVRVLEVPVIGRRMRRSERRQRDGNELAQAHMLLLMVMIMIMIMIAIVMTIAMRMRMSARARIRLSMR